MNRLNSSLKTTAKQVKRSGWLAYASLSVMTLACLVTSIFGFLAYTAALFLQSVEQEPQIYAVFEIGTPENDIRRVQAEWETYDGVAYINYTSEEQAKQEFYNAQKNINELAANAVQERRLPATLAIRVNSLDYADKISEKITRTKAENASIKSILFSRDIVNNIREVFFWLRLGGGIIMFMLLLVIVLFTLLTVEFRMHSRSEEIEIMQLVGGSLGYIRLPFILEGMFYGAVGAVISNTILGVLIVIIQTQLSSGQLNYLKDLLGRFAWPDLNLGSYLLLFIVITLLASILGGINSFIAIRRYIK